MGQPGARNAAGVVRGRGCVVMVAWILLIVFGWSVLFGMLVGQLMRDR